MPWPCWLCSPNCQGWHIRARACLAVCATGRHRSTSRPTRPGPREPPGLQGLQARQLTGSPPGQVLYKLAWSESVERDCTTFCAKK